MKKIILKVALSALSLTCGMQAMKAKRVEEKTFPLSKATCWLVHATQVFPKNGCIIAGSMLQMKAKNSQSDNQKAPLLGWYGQAQSVCTAWRNTVHWSVNSLVYPHDSNQQSMQMKVSRDAYPYVIIEPLRAFNGKALRGYWQDVYHLGGHQLSNDAIILVSSDDTVHKDFIGDFKGKIIVYEGDQRKSVELLLAQQEAPVLYPCMDGLQGTQQAWKHHSATQQLVLLNGKKMKAVELAEVLDLDNSVLLSTTLGQTHQALAEFFMELRSCQLIDCLWSTLFPYEDELGMSRCVTCKVDKEKVEHQKLLACSACHQATYCSAPCQSVHWKNHKESCQLLKGCVAQLNHIHKRYLGQCELLGVDTFTSFMQEIVGSLDSIAQQYPTEREQRIMATYKHYITLLLSLLYSPAAEYAEKRAAFKVATAEGFRAFVKEIRRMVDQYETLIGQDVCLAKTSAE